MTPAERRKEDDAILARLISERGTWDEHWRDLADHFAPRSSRFNSGDRNKGGKKNAKLLTASPARAARTQSAGMFTSVTSPARPWFILGLEDAERGKFQPVKEWLDDCTRRIRDIIAGSNFYKAAPAMMRDLGVFGTAAVHVDEDPDDVIRCYNYPIGSYYLANSARLAVDLVVRRFSMTARQICERFGEKNAPPQVRDACASGRGETWFPDVIHIVGPNRDFDEKRLDAKFKKYRSAYYLQSDPAGRYLSESGYDEFPVLCPRWQTNGEDVYGESPAMLALPDARSLMIYEKRIAQAIEKKVNPPLVAPIELEKAGVEATPGSKTFVSSANAGAMRSMYDLNAFQVDHAAAKARELRHDIDATMYVDLFLMLSNSDRRQVTAEEIRAKQEEKILALGEPLEHLNDEALGPFIERVFAIADRQGRLPPAPPEAQGAPIKIEYVSILHQVQRMVALGQIDRAAQFIGGLAGLFPDVVDKFDADQAVDEYAEGLGLSPRIIRSKEDAGKIRQARAQAQQQQAAMQQAETAVQGAKILSETDTGGANALTDLMRSTAGAV
jgi:hypothetical protein